MPFTVPATVPLWRRILSLLASNRTGFVLALLIALELAVCSFFIPDPRAAGALPFSESFVPFLEQPSLKYWWFYLLAVTVTLYGITMAARIVVELLPAGPHGLRGWGITLMHASLLLGLVAHLAAGATAQETGRVEFGPGATWLEGSNWRLIDSHRDVYPDGRLRRLEFFLEASDFAGKRTLHSFGYNNPLVFNWGATMILLDQPSVVTVVRMHDATGTRLLFTSGGRLSEDLFVLNTSTHKSLRSPMVYIGPNPGSDSGAWYAVGTSLPVDTHNTTLWIDDIVRDGGVTGYVRVNSGVPVLILASLVFLLGLALYLLRRV